MMGAALALALLAASPPADELIPTSDLQWLRTPTSEELGTFLPTDTRIVREARVVLQCRADREGWLQDCAVIEEMPADYGLARFAMKLATYFRLNPRTKSGAAIAGRLVQVPIVLKEPE